jgi:hypothetical protein
MNEQGPRRLTGIVSNDPLANLPIDTSISYEPVVMGGSNARIVPEGVSNWDFFQGAVLAVITKRLGSSFVVEGTAVVTAPGLALSATHVLDSVLPYLASEDAAVACIGVRSEGLDIWNVRKVSYTESDDLAYLSLELASPWVEGWHFTSLGVTTRAPRQGEKLTIVGFKFDNLQEEDGRFTAAGHLYAAAGTVTAVYSPLRHPTLMPYPAIEISCGSLGAMSGGAVLDGDGLLVGIISRGLETEDRRGPTFAAWIVGALNRKLEVPWPPGLYGDEIHVLDIPEQLLRIEGRDAISVIDENRFRYRIWFDR